MKILGVDPGTRRTGVGLVETQGNQYKLLHFEVIAIKESLPIARRLLIIYESLSKIIRQFTPDVLALENIFFGKDIRAMIKIGEARACAMLAASAQGIDVIEYPPARIKQSVTGNGRATKDQVQSMIKTLLNLKVPLTPDSADALAVAICHIHSKRRIETSNQLPVARKKIFAGSSLI